MIVSKIAEYKQINTRTESYTVTVPSEYDEEGNLISEEHEETRTREVPVTGMIYRDMTPEEIAELEKIQTELPEEQPTQQDRIEAQVMYTALMTDTCLRLHLYTKKQIRQFCNKGVITPEQYKQITGEDY